MKSKLFKVAAVIMALAVVCLSLAGCGKEAEKTAAPTIKPQATHRPYKDLGGETYRVLYHKVMPNKDATASWANKGYTGQKMIDRINEIQAGYNCKIEYVGDGTDHNSWGKLHTYTMAGAPTADIAFVGQEHVIQSFEQNGGGALYQILNDYKDELELDNAEVWDQTVTKKIYTVDGLTAGVQPNISGIELVNWGSIMFFNKTMLEREGLWSQYNLYEMQKNKTWTWDVMDEIGRKVTKDTNSDGKIDQFGMIYDPHAHVAFNASNSNGGLNVGFYGITENGEAKFYGREPNRMRVLESFAKWGAKGNKWLYTKEFGQEPMEGAQKEFSSGNCAFIIELGSTLESFKNQGMQETIGAVAVPMGPDNTTKEYYIGREWFQPWVIPKGIDAMATIEGSPYTKSQGAALVLRDLAAPLYTPEELEIETENMLANLIGNETGIEETYKMLGDPSRVVNFTESPFVATWVGPIASYHGSFPTIINGEITVSNLNAEYGDSIQVEMNRYWQKVKDGAANINAIRNGQA